MYGTSRTRSAQESSGGGTKGDHTRKSTLARSRKENSCASVRDTPSTWGSRLSEKYAIFIRRSRAPSAPGGLRGAGRWVAGNLSRRRAGGTGRGTAVDRG